MYFNFFLRAFFLYVTASCICVTASLPHWSPSQAYLKQVPFKKVANILGNEGVRAESIKHFEGIVHERIIPREMEYCDDHVVFYHGQERWFLIYYIFQKMLYEALKRKDVNNFEFLRNETDLYSSKKSVEEFLTENNFYINDHNPAMSKVLLAVNLSFPGVLDTGESTLIAYLFGGSVNPPRCRELFYENLLSLFKQYTDIDEKPYHFINENYRFINEKVEEIDRIVTSVTMNHNLRNQLLLQLFLPHSKVRDYAYFAGAGGSPKMVNISLTEDPLMVTGADIRRIFEKDHKELVRENLMSLQARVLLHKDLFSDPRSGVKMFLYHDLPADLVKKICIGMQKIVNDIVTYLITH